MIARANRGSFSLVEVIIAMTIALVVSGTLFFVFFSTQRNTEKGIEILDFLRKATILVESVKMDIRSSLRSPDSVQPKGSDLVVKRSVGDSTETVTYRYDAAGHFVTRTAGSDRKLLGSDGRQGVVKSFSVKHVEALPGFYRIDVEFEPIVQRKASQGAAPIQQDPGARPAQKPYEFHTLVNKRTPEESDRDVLWNYAYDPVR